MKILIAVKYTLKKLHIDVCMHIHKVLFKKFISLTLEYQIRKFLGNNDNDRDKCTSKQQNPHRLNFSSDRAATHLFSHSRHWDHWYSTFLVDNNLIYKDKETVALSG